MHDRSRARGWAVQVLYAWEARGGEGSPMKVLGDFLEARRIAEVSREYLEHLIGMVTEHRAEIDGALQQELTNWRIERLSTIDRNILRLAAAEMCYIPDVPLRVSIREAILLAEKYGTADSPRFVNGVLDALMHRIDDSAADPDQPTEGT